MQLKKTNSSGNFQSISKMLDAETGNYYYGARYYNPKWSIWLSVDPLAERYPGWSPYNYTLYNPVRFVDPDGRSVAMPDDRYKIDRTGQITFYDNKGGDAVDYLMDENGNEIKIMDTHILPQLTKERENWGYTNNGIRHNGSYAITKSFSQAKKIFEFAAKASNVEWALRKHTNRTFIGTNHFNSVANGNLILPLQTLLVDIHSHPGVKVGGRASGISLSTIRKTGFSYNDFRNGNSGLDLGRALNFYGKLIKMGKITQEKNYQNAPNFFIFLPDANPSKYIQYDPWNTKL